MSQGTEYSGYGSHSAAGSPEEEIWFVAVAPNDIQQMTLDQLDEAYSTGRITEETAVWTDGMEQWAPLAEVANMSEEEEEAAPPQPPATQPSAMRSAHQVQPHYGATAHASGVDVPATHAPVSHGGMSGQQVISGYDLSAATIQDAPGFQQSTAPVALNLEDEVPEQPVKSRRKLGVWLLAAAGVAAAGFTLVRSDVLSGGEKQASKAKVSEAALAAQPYDPGPASKAEATKGADPDPEPKTTAQAKAEVEGEAPIGSVGSAGKEKEKEAEAGKAAKKSSLKRSFSGALKGKSKKKKARTSRSRKRRASRSTRASNRKKKKQAAPQKKVKRTSSAFDPLNGSLP